MLKPDEDNTREEFWRQTADSYTSPGASLTFDALFLNDRAGRSMYTNSRRMAVSRTFCTTSIASRARRHDLTGRMRVENDTMHYRSSFIRERRSGQKEEEKGADPASENKYSERQRCRKEDSPSNWSCARVSSFVSFRPDLTGKEWAPPVSPKQCQCPSTTPQFRWRKRKQAVAQKLRRRLRLLLVRRQNRGCEWPCNRNGGRSPARQASSC